ncbi:hypothetical protein TVAG_423410 [Trichomonas vaginalis G3]|uniref:WW domain-containing protein n=1 Tax=Trichomonas vaginalis (strain ATCC PRA-98 / G3) TaxID=412133 RepID=A2DTH9_TRIV3|nr:RH04127P family [Trichomonas vaginalis G3]EAY16288.1 hypothetical protein TVAG_423410 [Trichomonas vaginalis G3]KAI5523437.1 RH04127P family [Trichomonas vaginalis G3]|eukprot:XP_001328511.1 hypothetical protein [Trichomonas vaginalis G3]
MEDYEEIVYRPPRNPSAQEIDLYCQFLGLDPKEDSELLWIAVDGLKAPLPEGWTYYEHKTEDKVLFYNKKTGETLAHHPLDDHYFTLFQEEKKKLDERRHRNQNVPDNKQKSKINQQNKVNNELKNDSSSKISQTTAEYQAILDKKIMEIERKHEEKLNEIRLQNHYELEKEKKLLVDLKAKNNNLEKSLQFPKPDPNTQATKIQYQNDLKMLKKDYENELKLLDENHSKEISEQQKRFSQELTDLQTEQAKTIRELKQQHEIAVEKLKRDNEKYISMLSNQFESDKKAIISDNTHRLSLIQAEAQKEIDNFLDNHRKEIESMRKRHEEKIKEIKIKAAKNLENVSKEASKSPIRVLKDVNDIEIEQKKKENQREIEKIESLQQQKISQRKTKFEQQIRKIEAENDLKIASIKDKNNQELKNYQKQLEQDKKKIYSQVRKEIKEKAMSNSISTFTIDTIRIASIKPQSKTPKKGTQSLRISNRFALSLEDENDSDNSKDVSLSLSRIITVFERKVENINIKTKKNDSDNSTEVDFQSDSFDSELDSFGQTDTRTIKLSKAAEKAKSKFSNSAEKVSSEITQSIKELDNKTTSLRTYCSEQNRDLAKNAIEFQQRTLEVSKMFNSTLLELESAHRMALSSLIQPRDIINGIHPPVHLSMTTPPPRWRKAQIISDESSDLDSTTIRSIKNYYNEQKEAKTLNARLKRQDNDNIRTYDI